MAEITLSDYVGYIFVEIIKARSLADDYSKTLAGDYSKDEILKHFSVPRFKIQKMEVTIPVLVSGARFQSTVEFKMSLEEFHKFIVRELENVAGVIESTVSDTAEVPPRRSATRRRQSTLRVSATERLVLSDQFSKSIQGFHTTLSRSRDASSVPAIVKAFWPPLFRDTIKRNSLTEKYQAAYPKDQLLEGTLKTVSGRLEQRMVVSKSGLESLLVNPETYSVKDGSNESSVFVVKTELTEEGLFVRSVKDAQTGVESKVVDFE